MTEPAAETPAGPSAAGPPAWLATTSHLRAVVFGALVASAAVLLRRPDLLVLATPMLVIGVWATFTRPRSAPQVSTRILHTTVREGEGTRLRTTIGSGAGIEHAVLMVASGPFTVLRPAAGVLTRRVDGRRAESVNLNVIVRSTRWGQRRVGPAVVVATSTWGGFRWDSGEMDPVAVTTLPAPTVFDANAATPHPTGLVGLNRSNRAGDGNEFASIRPFQVGDRLRRIHWPVSMRTGNLHVTSTWSDQDSHVILVVDASSDIGDSAGVDGAASSLDLTVRAAGAIAEHYLRRGDRVGLQVFGTASQNRVPEAAGRAHLRRVLDTLSMIEPATERYDLDLRATFGLSAGALVIVLSPMISAMALGRTVSLARRGLSVVAIDTLPRDLVERGDPATVLAWRVRLLERSREIRRVSAAGVPVVQWRGPGSLDQVLRDVARRGRTPRMARR